ncbi:MAG TPA: VOC family protein [Actinoplanes sp.]|jgi:catechol 2,3-dioxygenase-like lactoylglutathione lyase family enzyme|nr:VOC family protein [Actinoplanes sp.]
MSSTDTSTKLPEAGTIDMKLEVVTLPVSDVDRAKRFYQSLGWRMDADIVVGDQTYASFSDPDGNGWLLQEIKTRLPGREWED